MTKKHFIELADRLRAMKPVVNATTTSDGPMDYAKGFAHGELRNWNFTVESLADFCEKQNPRFDRVRWLGYIAGTNGANGGKVKEAAAEVKTCE